MGVVQSLPLDFELIVYSGTNFRRELRWLPDGVTPVDFTGWSALMPIGPSGGVASLVLSDTNGGIILSSVGQIIIGLTPTQTAALRPGIAYYSLDLTDTTGFVRRFLRGRISVVQDVKAT